jgi:integrase
MGLLRSDIDSTTRVVAVRRTIVNGKVKPYGKTDRSLRAVGLPDDAAAALAAVPARIDTRVLFPAARGGHLALERWRWREWTPALRAAGIAHRAPNALRHTFASFQIAAGTSVYEIARLMGTSVAMIDQTYGHLLPDAPTRARTALDAFVKAQRDTATERMGTD